MNKDFHYWSDKKGPTITLFQIKGGDIIGGFATAQWEDGPRKFVPDPHSFLFNLTSSRLFKGSHNAGILCATYRGPKFTSTSNDDELCAWDEPFNDNKCSSYANKPGYSIGVDAAGKNTLTNSENGDFTISELEVWEIVNVENLVLPVQEKSKGTCSNQ